MSSSNPLASAKAALGTAEKSFPSRVAQAAGVKTGAQRMTAPVKAITPAPKTPSIFEELKAKKDNVNQYAASLPKMHKGGIVPGEKGEEVPIMAKAGEKVIPAGRSSEYRQVYHKRLSAKKQTRQGGGNTPVKGEAHDQKKA